MTIIKRFIEDKKGAVNKALNNYQKKNEFAYADVGLMSTRRKYGKDRETYKSVEGFNVTFIIGPKRKTK